MRDVGGSRIAMNRRTFFSKLPLAGIGLLMLIKKWQPKAKQQENAGLWGLIRPSKGVPLVIVEYILDGTFHKLTIGADGSRTHLQQRVGFNTSNPQALVHTNDLAVPNDKNIAIAVDTRPMARYHVRTGLRV